MLTYIGSACDQTSCSGGISHHSESIVQTGNLLFVSGQGDYKISSFGVNPNNGKLSYTGNSTPYYSSSSNFEYLAVDPSGKYLYAADDNDSVIISYSIGTNGALTQLSVTNAGSSATATDSPLYIAVDPSGNYLYVTYYVNGSLSSYSITDGVLSSEPVSQNANAAIAGDHYSIAVTPGVLKYRKFDVGHLPLAQYSQPNNANKEVKK